MIDRLTGEHYCNSKPGLVLMPSQSLITQHMGSGGSGHLGGGFGSQTLRIPVLCPANNNGTLSNPSSTYALFLREVLHEVFF